MQAAATKEPPVKLLLTINEAAQALSLSLRFVYTLVLTHQIQTIKIGRSRRVPVTALQAFIEQQSELS
jgi:excisionase family DNA binding protein